MQFDFDIYFLSSDRKWLQFQIFINPIHFVRKRDFTVKYFTKFISGEKQKVLNLRRLQIYVYLFSFFSSLSFLSSLSFFSSLSLFSYVCLSLSLSLFISLSSHMSLSLFIFLPSHFNVSSLLFPSLLISVSFSALRYFFLSFINLCSFLLLFPFSSRDYLCDACDVEWSRSDCDVWSDVLREWYYKICDCPQESRDYSHVVYPRLLKFLFTLYSKYHLEVLVCH